MNPTAVFSKSGKGVQEASGKTSHLSRADRAVLSAFDGRITVAEVAEKIGKPFDPKFEQIIEQLEKDGFVRQVSAGVGPPQPAARHGAPAKQAAPPSAAEELDFTIFAAPKAAPARPSAPPADLAAKAREEAARKAKEEHATSYKARQEIERARAEAEARAKAAAQARLQAEAAAKARVEAEAKGKTDTEAAARAKAAEAEAKVRAEAEAKVKAAREAAVRAAAEAKAKAEAELQAKLEAERAKAREEAERIRQEAEEKARREAEELRQRLEEERKAREEADAARRKAEEQARAEAERIRREAEEKARKEAEEKARREAEELRQRLEEERKAREQAEAARKKAEEQAREEERRRREEEERRARAEAERKAREEKERAEREEREKQARAERERQERAAREREEQERKEREKLEEAERERAEEEKAQARAPAQAGGFSDSLLADLATFGEREDEDKKAREAADAAKKKADKQARAEAEEARKKAEQQAREEAARREKQEAAERKAKEEAERKAKAEAKEAEEREAEERKRKARESVAAREAAEEDDIGVSDEDLDMDEVKRDQKALSQEARRAAREREREQEKERQRERERESSSREAEPEVAAAPPRIRRPMRWGKPLAVGVFILLIAAIGGVHVMPISTADYERAASDALGVPVRIGSARLSLFTGVQLKLANVAIGEAKIADVRAFPAIGSLFGEKKTFSRIELEGVTLPQQAIGAALLSKAKGASFEVERIVAQKVKLEGPLALPVVDADLRLGADGSVTAATVRGPENLNAKLEPKGTEVEFDMHANTFALPVAPEVTMNLFGMKGVASARGMDIPAWSATLYDGVLSGTARMSWDGTYSLDGAVTVRGMNVAVFAPALVSEGKVEGTGRFSMSGADPGKLGNAARLEGNFNITKGVLGSIDISRAISTGGRQASGRTPFTELVGQGVYDKGAVQLRNITIGAGALNAGASADIAQGGALSGRIVADVRAPTQTLRATLNLGGTVKEPQVRN